MRPDDFVQQTSRLHAVALPRAEEEMGKAIDLFTSDGTIDLNDPERRRTVLFNLANVALKATYDTSLALRRDRRLPLAD